MLTSDQIERDAERDGQRRRRREETERDKNNVRIAEKGRTKTLTKGKERGG